MEIDIATNARVFITGKTGSGKTYLAKRLLENAERLVVIDIKDNLREEMNLVPPTHDNWRKFLLGKPVRIQATAPLGTDELGYYHEVFRRAYSTGDCIVHINEILGVVRSAVDLPFWLKAIYTRGREPRYKRKRIIGGNIGVIAETQRPAHIPVFCMTESEHFFVFQLQNPDDRKRVADYTVPELRDPITDEHGFWYYATRSDHAEYIPELKD